MGWPEASGGLSLSRISRYDVILITLLVLIGVYLVTRGRSGVGTGHTVWVESVTGESLTFDIHGDRTIDVRGVIGTTTIRVEGGTLRFISSPCPHGLCVDKGSISQAGEWIACLPNGVVAGISGQADYDGITP